MAQEKPPQHKPKPTETASMRKMRAQVAAHTSWAKTPDRKARTAKARAANLSRFESSVDPAGTMDPGERQERAESARKAHFKAMALRSAKVRAQRKAAS